MDLVNYEIPLAQYGSNACPNSPNPCYCTGACNKDYVPGASNYTLKPAQPINEAHAAKMKEIQERNMPLKPVFVQEHNAQKDVTTNCSTRDYRRPESLAPGQGNQEAVTERNAEVAAARKCNDEARSALEQRISSGELEPGINAGRIVMPKEAQLMEAQLIQDTLSEVADQVALQGAIDYQFAPLKEVLDGLEDILRYKNKKYGGTGLSNTGTFSKAPALEKLLARADDKIARIQNSSELQKNDIIDLAGYLILICANQGWNNFSEFQD